MLFVNCTQIFSFNNCLKLCTTTFRVSKAGSNREHSKLKKSV